MSYSLCCSSGGAARRLNPFSTPDNSCIPCSGHETPVPLLFEGVLLHFLLGRGLGRRVRNTTVDDRLGSVGALDPGRRRRVTIARRIHGRGPQLVRSQGGLRDEQGMSVVISIVKTMPAVICVVVRGQFNVERKNMNNSPQPGNCGGSK